VKWLMMVFSGLVVIGLAWPTTATLPYTTQIVIEDGSPYFIPVTATVVSGNPIRWDNPTPTHHTITHKGCMEDGSPCLFDSGTIPPEGQFTIPGLAPGTYIYHCRIHPIMRGVVTVTDASQSPSQL
jgi:plastocyanin